MVFFCSFLLGLVLGFGLAGFLLSPHSFFFHLVFIAIGLIADMVSGVFIVDTWLVWVGWIFEIGTRSKC